MINLLERTLPRESDTPPVLGPRSGQLLEWPAVKRQISCRCLNRRSAEMLQARQPFHAKDRIELEHALIDELRPGASENRWPPLIDLTPTLELLEQDEKWRAGRRCFSQKGIQELVESDLEEHEKPTPIFLESVMNLEVQNF